MYRFKKEKEKKLGLGVMALPEETWSSDFTGVGWTTTSG